MSLEKLKQEIVSNAERQAQALLESARREADGTVSEARAKAREIARAEEAKAQEEAKELVLESKAAALLQAKRMESEAREQMVGDVLKEVKRHLKDATESKTKYEKVFDALARQAIRALGEKEFVLHANARDKKLGEKYGRVAGTISTMGGVMVSKPDGSIRIDNTFEALVEENEEKLKQKAFEQLFSRKELEASASMQAEKKKHVPASAVKKKKAKKKG